MKNWHESQRGYFFGKLLEEMATNKNIWVLTADLGYKMLDKLKDTYPDRFINVGASEQSLLDIAVGLAKMGKIPVCYSITPFLIYRPFESLRNYLNHDQVPVILAGGGRDKDYSHDGFSHWSEEDRQIMACLPNIRSYWPQSKEDVPGVLQECLSSKLPCYINLCR